MRYWAFTFLAIAAAAALVSMGGLTGTSYIAGLAIFIVFAALTCISFLMPGQSEID